MEGGSINPESVDKKGEETLNTEEDFQLVVDDVTDNPELSASKKSVVSIKQE